MLCIIIEHVERTLPMIMLTPSLALKQPCSCSGISWKLLPACLTPVEQSVGLLELHAPCKSINPITALIVALLAAPS